jgi:hypothetical protein
MTDTFNNTNGETAPAHNAFVVTPSNTTDFKDDAGEYVPRAIYVGVSGNITVDMLGNGTSILFSNVPVGMWSIRVSKIYATGTTATNMVGVY